MATSRITLVIFFGVNLLALFLICITHINEVDLPTYHTILPGIEMQNIDEKLVDEIKKESSPYKFDDPLTAYSLLKQLDIFEVVESSEVPRSNYKSTDGAFKGDFEYCDKHRAYIVYNPELIFEKQHFVSNYERNHKLRSQVFPLLGTDMHREVRRTTKGAKIDLKVDVNMFYTESYYFFWKQVGKQFSCLSQASNHIPGHDKMYQKGRVSQSVVEYGKSYKSKPQCFGFDKHFLKNWVLKDKEQCLDFFKEFNSEYYQELKKERNIVYFRKIAASVHQGRGVFPVTDEEEKNIREMYQNGTLCGENQDNNLIQYNVWNSLLVKKRKPGMRVFMLVASTNPLIAYYHDGYVRLSLNEYDINAQDRGTFVTNVHVNVKEAHDESNPFANMTHQEIDDYTCWMNSQFHEYLMEQGLVKDPNWLDNYFRKELKTIMVHLLRMSKDEFLKRSSVYELWGLDFVMDENLKLWFIEANASPLVDGFTNDTTKLMNQMLIDTFDIEFALLRSRMKRVIAYVNDLTWKVEAAAIPDLEIRRQEFKELTQNRFEPEFMPRPNTTFEKIFDENLDGVERYSGLLDKDCLKF